MFIVGSFLCFVPLKYLDFYGFIWKFPFLLSSVSDPDTRIRRAKMTHKNRREEMSNIEVLDASFEG